MGAKNETGESWYTVERLADMLGCSERSVVKWVRELRDKHLIDRIQLKFNGISFAYLRPYPEDAPKEVRE